MLAGMAQQCLPTVRKRLSVFFGFTLQSHPYLVPTYLPDATLIYDLHLLPYCQDGSIGYAHNRYIK